MNIEFAVALLYDLSLSEIGINQEERKSKNMAYTTMLKLITNQNNKLTNGTITQEQYDLWKESAQNKLDVFLACNRLTSAQYEELVGMLQ